MIANSRGGLPSLFKHEFFDGKIFISLKNVYIDGKQEELEKILHKKLKEKSKTTKSKNLILYMIYFRIKEAIVS